MELKNEPITKKKEEEEEERRRKFDYHKIGHALLLGNICAAAAEKRKGFLRYQYDERSSSFNLPYYYKSEYK